MACLAGALSDGVGTNTSVKKRSRVSNTQTQRNVLLANTGARWLSPVYVHTEVAPAQLQTAILCGLQFNATTMCLGPSIGCFWRVHVGSLTEFKKTSGQRSELSEALKGRTVFWFTHPQSCTPHPNTACCSVFFFAKKRGAWGLFHFFCL